MVHDGDMIVGSDLKLHDGHPKIVGMVDPSFSPDLAHRLTASSPSLSVSTSRTDGGVAGGGGGGAAGDATGTSTISSTASTSPALTDCSLSSYTPAMDFGLSSSQGSSTFLPPVSNGMAMMMKHALPARPDTSLLPATPTTAATSSAPPSLNIFTASGPGTSNSNYHHQHHHHHYNGSMVSASSAAANANGTFGFSISPPSSPPHTGPISPVSPTSPSSAQAAAAAAGLPRPTLGSGPSRGLVRLGPDGQAKRPPSLSDIAARMRLDANRTESTAAASAAAAAGDGESSTQSPSRPRLGLPGRLGASNLSNSITAGSVAEEQPPSRAEASASSTIATTSSHSSSSSSAEAAQSSSTTSPAPPDILATDVFGTPISSSRMEGRPTSLAMPRSSTLLLPHSPTRPSPLARSGSDLPSLPASPLRFGDPFGAGSSDAAGAFGSSFYARPMINSNGPAAANGSGPGSPGTFSGGGAGGAKGYGVPSLDALRDRMNKKSSANLAAAFAAASSASTSASAIPPLPSSGTVRAVSPGLPSSAGLPSKPPGSGGGGLDGSTVSSMGFASQQQGAAPASATENSGLLSPLRAPMRLGGGGFDASTSSASSGSFGMGSLERRSSMFETRSHAPAGSVSHGTFLHGPPPPSMSPGYGPGPPPQPPLVAPQMHQGGGYHGPLPPASPMRANFGGPPQQPMMMMSPPPSGSNQPINGPYPRAPHLQMHIGPPPPASAPLPPPPMLAQSSGPWIAGGSSGSQPMRPAQSAGGIDPSKMHPLQHTWTLYFDSKNFQPPAAGPATPRKSSALVPNTHPSKQEAGKEMQEVEDLLKTEVEEKTMKDDSEGPKRSEAEVIGTSEAESGQNDDADQKVQQTAGEDQGKGSDALDAAGSDKETESVGPAVAPAATAPTLPLNAAAPESWEAALKVLGAYQTVESFFATFATLKRPSQIERNSNYHLFKNGIKPMWEDEANANGGKWTLTFRGCHPGLLDRSWMWLVLGLIGEEMDASDELTGAVCSTRLKGDRISIWLRSSAAGPERANKIAKKLVKLLNVETEPGTSLEFSTITGSPVEKPERYITLSNAALPPPQHHHHQPPNRVDQYNGPPTPGPGSSFNHSRTPSMGPMVVMNGGAPPPNPQVANLNSPVAQRFLMRRGSEQNLATRRGSEQLMINRAPAFGPNGIGGPMPLSPSYGPPQSFMHHQNNGTPHSLTPTGQHGNGQGYQFPVLPAPGSQLKFARSGSISGPSGNSGGPLSPPQTLMNKTSLPNMSQRESFHASSEQSTQTSQGQSQFMHHHLPPTPTSPFPPRMPYPILLGGSSTASIGSIASVGSVAQTLSLGLAAVTAAGHQLNGSIRMGGISPPREPTPTNGLRGELAASPVGMPAAASEGRRQRLNSSNNTSGSGDSSRSPSASPSGGGLMPSAKFISASSSASSRAASGLRTPSPTLPPVPKIATFGGPVEE